MTQKRDTATRICAIVGALLVMSLGFALSGSHEAAAILFSYTMIGGAVFLVAYAALGVEAKGGGGRNPS